MVQNIAPLDTSGKRVRIAMWICAPLALLGLAATFSSLGADLSSSSDADDFVGDWFVYWALTFVTSTVVLQGSRTLLNHELLRLGGPQKAENAPKDLTVSTRAWRRARAFLWIGIVSSVVGAAGIVFGLGVSTGQPYGDAVFPVLLVFLLVLLLGVRVVVQARRVLRIARATPSEGEGTAP